MQAAKSYRRTVSPAGKIVKNARLDTGFPAAGNNNGGRQKRPVENRGWQKVPFEFSARNGFSNASDLEPDLCRLGFGTVLTSGLLTSKPVNGVFKAMSENRPEL